MVALARYRELIDNHIQQWIGRTPRTSLYSPMAYIMGLPAKRIRPAATLMSCELFGGSVSSALDAALGLELFHNFTLMHDDIMDEAPLRRGKSTVHMKWDVNAAILSGDAMLVKAYQLITSRPEIISTFNAHALMVCEGQQSDMDFEQRTDVSLEEYEEMIRKKTAVLLSCAMRIGALIAGASTSDQELIAGFGEELGMAFQLRDDLLDAFGDPGKTGKRLAGDLSSGKKTWLLIKALELEERTGSARLIGQLQLPPEQRDVQLMLSLIGSLGARDAAEQEVLRHESAALAAIEAIDVSADRKVPLLELAGVLMARDH
ncbi:MAG: polyprenyl synthetase family protein [Bacteroidota bacterium]|nr:polyprenyl synthetase family protein [Bacteroidota bacterium]